MSTSGVQPISSNGLMAYQRMRQPAPPPTAPRTEEVDTVTLSSEALQQATEAVPAAVLAAVADLQGSQADMAADFRTIGDYFRDHGGRAALDIFMRENFSEAQLRAFPPPVEGARNDPSPPPRPMPETLSAVVSDLKGDRTNMAEDLKAIGDYFREHGGREAHRAFMRATFTEAERQAIRQFREESIPFSTSGSGSESA